jgi:hypothetical protein
MKTILYGAFGRHNFGDLLFPHIVHRLIKENIKYELPVSDNCENLRGDHRDFHHLRAYRDSVTNAVKQFLNEN